MNPFRYCGEYFDRESDTIYLRARSYDPGTGRFASEDPIGAGLNWYTYCGNNPVSRIDPWGLVSVNLVDYTRAMGADVEVYIQNGVDMATIIFDNNEVTYNLNSGIMDDIRINARFGFSSFLTDKERNTGVGIGIRNNTLYRDIITPEKSYYDLDYKGYTIRLYMNEYTMAVNMEAEDGGILSSNYDDSTGVALWLKYLYYEQYQKEFEVDMMSIAIELKAHAAVWDSMSRVPWVGEHARIANIGVAGHELPWERALWDYYANDINNNSAKGSR